MALYPRKAWRPLRTTAKAMSLSLLILVFATMCVAQDAQLTDNATFPISSADLGVRGPGAVGGVAVSSVKFDVSTNLPAGTPANYVAKATITVYVRTVDSVGSFNLYRATNPWTHNDATAPAYDVSSPIAAGVAVSEANSFITVDVTSMVQQWLGTDGLGAGGLPNYGIVLVANAVDTSFAFDSKERAAGSHAARLSLSLNHASTADVAQGFSGTLAGDVTGSQSATVVTSVGSQSAANIAGSAIAVNAATNNNLADTLIKRDASGNFSANTITANLNGNASTATLAETANGLAPAASVSGSQVVGDISGQASSITGTVNASQVSGTVAKATNADVAQSVLRAAQSDDVLNPVDGQIYYDTTDNVFKIFEASSSTWKTVDAAKASSLSPAASIDGSQITGTLSAVAVPGSAITGTIAAGQVSGALNNVTIPGYVDKTGDAMTGQLTLPSDGLKVGANQFSLLGGNVGIGTATPSQKLDIDGSVNLNSTDSAAAGVIFKGQVRFLHNFALPGTAGHNTFLGLKAGNFSMAGSTGVEGSYNTAIGEESMSFNTTGKNNTAVGFQSLGGNTTGRDNTASGQYALLGNTTGSYNTATGLEALLANTTSEYNTSTGYQSLHTNATGSYNTATGANALQFNTVGGYNTATGFEAMYYNIDGDFNSAYGYGALTYNTTGAYNTAIGTFAAINPDVYLLRLKNCTFLGYRATSSADDITNSMALGSGSQVTKSDQVVIGNSDIAETLLNGNVGIKTSTPTSPLTVAGTIESQAGGFKFPDGTVQTTAGSGGVTGVTAGDGLSGGGATGNVTLKVDPQVVALQSDLSSEASLRQSADSAQLTATTTLQNNLNTEITSRTSAETALQTQLDSRVAKSGDTMTGKLTLPANGFAVGDAQLVLANDKLGVGTNVPDGVFQIVQPINGTGTVSNAAGGTSVTGTNTQFGNTFKVGDTITIGSQTVAITAITSDMSMTTAQITQANTNSPYTLVGGKRLTVLGNGNVGVGNSAPTSKLTVSGVLESTSGGFKFPDNTTQTTAAVSGVPLSRTVNAKSLSADIVLTKADIGLGNADNTSDANKPVSVLQQAALDAKAPVNNPNFSGKVGIGTSSPQNTLQVNGSSGFNGTITSSVSSGPVFDGSATASNGGYFHLGTTVTDAYWGVASSAGKSPFSSLTLSSDALFFGTQQNVPLQLVTAGAVNMTLTAGNVGVGIDNPTSKMTVAGVVESKSGGFKFPDNTVQTTAATSGVPLSRTINGKALSNDVTLAKSDLGLSNVDNTSDINKPVSAAQQVVLDTKAQINNPTFTGNVQMTNQLEVKGSASINGTLNSLVASGTIFNNAAIGSDGGYFHLGTSAEDAYWGVAGADGRNPFNVPIQNYALFFGTKDNVPIQFVTATGAAMTVTGGGNVGIGIAAPTDRLQVKGTLRVDTLGTAGSSQVCLNALNQLANCSSSLRYKTQLSRYSHGLDVVRRLAPISFTWRSNSERDLGFAAEAVAEIEPLLVTRNDQGQVEGVKYDRMVAILVNSVKEQQKQIESQQKEIESLKHLVCRNRRTARGCK